MALPTSLQIARMTNSTIVDQVDNKVGELEQAICDLLGIPIDTPIAAAGFTFSAAGLTKLILQNLAANPAAAGEIVRSGTNLLTHTGSEVRTILTAKPIVKSANEIVNNSSTFQADDQLALAVFANEIWFVISLLWVSFPTSGGIKFAPTLPAGCTIIHGGIGTDVAGTTILKMPWAFGPNGIDFSQPGSGALQMIPHFMYIGNGANPGTVTLTWAQRIATAGDLTINAGSIMFPIRLG